MNQRIDYKKASPHAYQALLALEGQVRKSGLDSALVDLVYLRVSLINGCAFCIDMHVKDLRAAGESEQRIALLSVHREAPFYSERERAAFAWAEAMTALGEAGLSDAVHDEARRHFRDDELANLSLAVVTINAWNRMNVAFRVPAGNYQPRPR